MNKVIIMGRLTSDPELRETQNGKHICKFTVACDRYAKNGNETDFIRCVAFHDTGKNIARFFTKGRRILADGNLKTGSYDDKDGKKVYTTDVWVDRFEFVESMGNSNSGNTNSGNTVQSNSPIDINGFEIIGDEELPF